MSCAKVKAGEELVLKQESSGVRYIVEVLDSLRIILGNENVKTLTPKAETRIRSGYQAQISLKVEAKIPCSDSDQSTVTLQLTFGQPMSITVLTPNECDQNKLERYGQYQKHLDEYLANDSTKSAISSVQWLCQTAKDIFKGEALDYSPFSSEENEDDIELQNIQFSDIIEDPGSRIVHEGGNTNSKFYGTCRMCRNVLFDSSYSISDHSIPLFCDGLYQPNARCTSIFFATPPRWLEITGDTMEGKLCCSNCGARVGQWTWVGSKCSCGEWISPSFQFNNSKFDIKH